MRSFDLLAELCKFYPAAFKQINRSLNASQMQALLGAFSLLVRWR